MTKKSYDKVKGRLGENPKFICLMKRVKKRLSCEKGSMKNGIYMECLKNEKSMYEGCLSKPKLTKKEGKSLAKK